MHTALTPYSPFLPIRAFGLFLCFKHWVFPLLLWCFSPPYGVLVRRSLFHIFSLVLFVDHPPQADPDHFFPPLGHRGAPQNFTVIVRRTQIPSSLHIGPWLFFFFFSGLFLRRHASPKVQIITKFVPASAVTDHFPSTFEPFVSSVTSRRAVYPTVAKGFFPPPSFYRLLYSFDIATQVTTKLSHFFRIMC